MRVSDPRVHNLVDKIIKAPENEIAKMKALIASREGETSAQDAAPSDQWVAGILVGRIVYPQRILQITYSVC